MNAKYLLGLLATVAVTGCVTTEGAGQAPRSAASAPDGVAAAPVCRAEAARPIASGVYVPGGVAATLEEGRAVIRFAPRKGRCAEARAQSVTGTFVVVASRDACRRGEADADDGNVIATSDGETMLAKEVRGADHSSRVELGVVTYGAPRSFFGYATPGRRHVVERFFEAPAEGRGGGESHPGLVALPGERFLLMWLDGNAEGYRLRAQPVAGWGQPVGQALDLSPSDVSVIGRPSGAIGKDGRGMVTFLASNGHGFDVLAAPVTCEAPAEGGRE